MRIGYSILLGEYLSATQLAHKDCEYFQVVCPICKEPIFKVEPGQTTRRHYLSHYAQTRAFEEECELRAKKVSEEKIKEKNGFSRDQKLAYFLSVLQGAVITVHWGNQSRSIKRKMIRAQSRNTALSILRDVSHMVMRENEFISNFDEFAESYYCDVGHESDLIKTIRKRIAGDMMMSVLSPAARPSFDFLFNSSALYLGCRLGQLKERAEQPIRLRQYLGSILYGRRNDAMSALREASLQTALPPLTTEPMPYTQKLSAEIGHEMIGALLGIDYLSLLRSKNGGGAMPNSCSLTF